MKRFVPIVAVFSLILMGCPDPRNMPEATETYSYYESSTSQNGDTTGVDLYASITLPPLEDNDSVNRAPERIAAETLIQKYFDKNFKYGDNIDSCIVHYCQQIKKQFESITQSNANSNTPQWRHSNTVDFDYGTYGWEIITFSHEYYDYRGGENATERNDYITFDSKTGKLIHENDIFADFKENADNSGKNRAVLAKLLRDRLEKDCRLSSNLRISDFQINNVKPNGNFQITPESIIYHYETGEIASRLLGPQSIIIDKEQLIDIVDKSSPLFKFWFNTNDE